MDLSLPMACQKRLGQAVLSALLLSCSLVFAEDSNDPFIRDCRTLIGQADYYQFTGRFYKIPADAPRSEKSKGVWLRCSFTFDPLKVVPVSGSTKETAIQQKTEKIYSLFTSLSQQASVADLERLLKHREPKLRTVALALLFQKQDPLLLPLVVPLATDSAETFMREGEIPQQASRSRGPPIKQHIHEIAVDMLQFYMKLAGSSCNEERAQADFDDYWSVHKDLNYCTSWFAADLQGCLDGLPPSRECNLGIQEIRKRIDRLPPDERAWTLLCMRSVYPDNEFGAGYENMLVPEQEMVSILQKLGPDKLLAGLQGDIPLVDLDAAPPGGIPYRAACHRFILGHASALFAPRHCEALLEYARQNKNSQGWRAAAACSPTKAGAILHEGYEFLGKSGASDDEKMPLLVDLWKSAGESGSALISDWYYSPRSRYTDNRSDFIEIIAKIAQPSGKKLLAHLLKDARAGEIDSISLSCFASAVNQWLPEPLVSQDEITKLRGRNWKGGGISPESVPGVLDRLQKSIPRWNP